MLSRAPPLTDTFTASMDVCLETPLSTTDLSRWQSIKLCLDFFASCSSSLLEVVSRVVGVVGSDSSGLHVFLFNKGEGTVDLLQKLFEVYPVLGTFTSDVQVSSSGEVEAFNVASISICMDSIGVPALMRACFRAESSTQVRCSPEYSSHGTCIVFLFFCSS